MKPFPLSVFPVAARARCFGLVAVLSLWFFSGCTKSVTPAAPAYEGTLATSTKPWAPAAAGAIGGTIKSGTLRIRLSADRKSIIEAGFSVRDLKWTKQEEAIASTVSMESSSWSAEGAFPIQPNGGFALPKLGVEGRFSTPTLATATIHLTYHFNMPSFGGTPGTSIPRGPDITLGNGTVIPGTPAITIPGTPAMEGSNYTVELGTWDCILTATTDTGPLTPPPAPPVHPSVPDHEEPVSPSTPDQPAP